MSNKERRYKKILVDYVYFTKQLDNLGINRKYLGFYMIIEIMNLLINCNLRVVSFSKQIYPIVAKKFQKSPCTIERNVRSLIEKTWDIEFMKKINRYYPEDQKPACRDFLFMVKNYITNQMV